MLVMLSKLAFRNAKRSIRDYIIYLITVTLAFSLIFSFNLIIFSKDILELSSIMNSFQMCIIIVSIIVILVVGWLIYYTMKFMLQKRSKEFATYMILGIKKKQIIKLFLLENIILGVFSLIISFFIGIILSQLMTLIIMNIFQLPYQINFSFGSEPILLTLFYFCLIYLFSLWKTRRKIKKMKIRDLLYLDKTNEKKANHISRLNPIIFIFSLLCGIGALLLFHNTIKTIMENSSTPSGLHLIISLVLIIISIYGVTLTISDFLLTVLMKKKKIKYHGDNLIIIRQFSSKIKTMGFTLGTISLLVTLTWVSLNVSNMFYGVFQTQTENQAPYDIMIYNIYSETETEIGNDSPPLKQYLDFVSEYYTINEKLTYNVYTNRETPIRKYISNGLVGYQPYDCYLRLSDYNQLLKMRGLKEITLKDGEYFIHTFRDVEEELKIYLQTHQTIQVGEYTLHNKGMTSRNYTTAWSRGSSYIVVVPDQVITDNFEIINQITAIDTKEETTEEFAEKMRKKFPAKVYVEDRETYQTMISIQQVTVKGEVESENRSMLTITTFSLMYLAFIFIAVVGTILSIQSLSDSTKYCYRYVTLHKLGVDAHQIYKTLAKQLLFFFIAPIIYPLIISISTAYSLSYMFDAFMKSDYSILGYVIFNIFLFLFIYLIYYIATYFGFKKNINEKIKE